MVEGRIEKMIISIEQLDLMLHALGGNQTKDRKAMGWRNYFVAPTATATSTTNDWYNWESLVADGWAIKLSTNTYAVSEQGLAILGVTLK
jgi:hypothetical protein